MTEAVQTDKKHLFDNRALKKMIVPLFWEQLLLLLVGIADTLVISCAGEAAVSGVSLVNQFNTVFIFLFTALAGGRLSKRPGGTSKRLEADSCARLKYDATAQQDREIIRRAAELAEKRGVSMAEISLAWLLTKVTAPVAGATKLHHIEGAARLVLSGEEVVYLEEPYIPHQLVGVMAQNTSKTSCEPHVWSTGDQKIWRRNFTMAKQTSGRKQLGAFAPKFAELNDDVLFGEVWSRTEALSLRDRSLVTVVSLLSQGLADSSFQFHLQSAKANGITKVEIAEIITHAAFYAGWPKAWAAFRMALEVWKEDNDAGDEKARHEREMLFPMGEPNDAYAKYFVGQSYLTMLTTAGVPIGNVTFEPGCRNNWHIHRAVQGGGQILLCTAGRGWYQEWGKQARELHPGDVVVIPAGAKHWHGAARDSWFTHLAVEIPGQDTANEWLEPVSDKDYENL